MKTKNIVGKNIYSELEKNFRAVWAVVIVSLISILGAFALAYYVYKDAGSKLYTINNKGDLIPLTARFKFFLFIQKKEKLRKKKN